MTYAAGSIPLEGWRHRSERGIDPARVVPENSGDQSQRIRRPGFRFLGARGRCLPNLIADFPLVRHGFGVRCGRYGHQRVVPRARRCRAPCDEVAGGAGASCFGRKVPLVMGSRRPHTVRGYFHGPHPMSQQVPEWRVRGRMGRELVELAERGWWVRWGTGGVAQSSPKPGPTRPRNLLLLQGMIIFAASRPACSPTWAVGRDSPIALRTRSK